MSDRRGNSTPKTVNVFPLSDDNLQAVSFQGPANVKALHIVGRVTGDGDVVIVNEKLDIDILGDGETSCLCIVTLLLRAIRPKAENDLVPIGKRNAINERPICQLER